MKNNKLKRLADLKSLELDEEFLSSSKPSELRGRYSHIQVEAAEEEILLNDFDSMMDDLLSSDFETPTQLDGMMAVKLHKHTHKQKTSSRSEYVGMAAISVRA